MGDTSSPGRRPDSHLAQHADARLPDPRGLPRYVAPLPTWLENTALRLVWLLIAVNLVGTLFGFWYYTPQLSATPVVMWPLVPVSPLATLYMALSLLLWRGGFTGRFAQLIHVLAFIGCLKYGLWSVYVQLFIEDVTPIPFLLWQFLIWSHAGMVLQAFVIQRYAEFPLWALALATMWYTINDVFDFFLTVFGGPHHTWLNVFFANGGFDRSIPAYDFMVAGAVVATVVAVFLALATRIAILKYSV